MNRFGIILLLLFLSIGSGLFSQTITNFNQLQLSNDFENIAVTKIAEDSLSSSFIIQVKNEVAEHKHLFHTENVYIIEGEGSMMLNDSIFNILPGMHIFIPANTFHSVKVTSEIPLKVLSIQSPKFDPSDRVLR